MKPNLYNALEYLRDEVLRGRSGHRVIRAGTFAGAFLVAAVAAAYFLTVVTGDGTSPTVKTGKGSGVTLPVNVSVSAGVTPGAKVPVTATFHNTTTQSVSFAHIAATIESPEVPSCAADMKLLAYKQGTNEPQSWWQTMLDTGEKPGDHAGPYAAGYEGSIFIGPAVDVMLAYTDTGADQSACEETGYRVKIHATE